jgi:hypothetical protein
MTWIGCYIKLIENLWAYMDNSFGVDKEGNVIWYHKYDQWMPVNQVKLLSMWDELGIPHEQHKQLFRKKLTIIGIQVDPNSLTFCLPEQALTDLLQELSEFTSWSEKKRGASWNLRKWQQVAGWMNWGFNVFPLLQPALNRLYPKIAGKDQPLTKIWVNNAVHEDLTGRRTHVTVSRDQASLFCVLGSGRCRCNCFL